MTWTERKEFNTILNNNSKIINGLDYVDFDYSNNLCYRFNWNPWDDTKYNSDLLLGSLKENKDVLKSFGITDFNIKTHAFGTTFIFVLNKTDKDNVKNSSECLNYLLTNLESGVLVDTTHENTLL